jgi:hypothetical protein
MKAKLFTLKEKKALLNLSNKETVPNGRAERKLRGCES